MNKNIYQQDKKKENTSKTLEYQAWADSLPQEIDEFFTVDYQNHYYTGDGELSDPSKYYEYLASLTRND